ncbi:MAG TPA: transglutaminase, partial [Bacteroidales bacterium]|nr:transglutaminase [Bacteroidales bacterium]
MKNHIVFSSLVILLLTGCSHGPDGTGIYKQIQQEFFAGRLGNTFQLYDSLKNVFPEEEKLIHKADSLIQIAERIYLDFIVTEEEIIPLLEKNKLSFTEKDIKEWEDNKWLEYRIIDGEKRYFNRAVSNLKLIRGFNEDRALRDSLEAGEEFSQFLKKHTLEVMRESAQRSKIGMPVKMIINYTLIVKPDIVPGGEVIRCWLPWPKEDIPRQNNIEFISASDSNYIISPDTMLHRTIYMEAIAVEGQPVVFKASFSYESSGQYHNPCDINIFPYDTISGLYKKYTSEELPHINFSDDVRSLADSITVNDSIPLKVLQSLYYWIDNNIPWAGALEYSTVPDIPGYVLRNRHGDCGMKTFLLLSLLRYKGIPARWQSGWMMHPGEENLHDWCEVYFEGDGWIPVDMSFGLQYSSYKRLRDFYMTGIDSYRLIVNTGVGGELFPPKKYLRSETNDFQRG